MSGLLVVILSLVLISCTGLSSQTDEVDPEPDRQEEIEAAVEEEKQTDRASKQPTPAPTFDHQVDMKVNGIIEENKGEEWWVSD